MAVSRSSDPASLFDAARKGDRIALPRLLSLVERGGDGSRAVAEIAYRAPLQAYSVGITGAPGAGKSTLTDRLINCARTRGFDGSDRADRLQAVDVATLPYPGFATDYKPLLVALLTVAQGVGIVTENLFFGRFRYVEELRRMGADIRTEGHHAVVRGVERLSGAPVRAFDVRAGAALVLAGLVADGETLITDAHHVDRGYEDLGGKLVSLGAHVSRS